MGFQILNTIDSASIESSSARLGEEKIPVLAKNAYTILGRLSLKRFVFLMANLAAYGTNFSENMTLIEKYFQLTPDLRTRLAAEELLHKFFLRKYEHEEAYNAFYKLIQKFYTGNFQSTQTPDDNRSGIVFFVHSPLFLAHTNALFKLLETRQETKTEISIFSLGFSAEFAQKCAELNVKYLVFDNLDPLVNYKEIIQKSKLSKVIVWVSVPVHLAYIAQFLDNTCLWTHKFHPNFFKVRKAIGADSMRRSEFSFFGKNWVGFDSGFNVVNQRITKENWSRRKNKFASVCREELINNKDHWKNVSIILSERKELVYYYCGKQAIHEKWCSLLKIPSSKVKFMGWLSKPEDFIREVSFLLEGPTLGHGVMAFEALSCGIPIIAPDSSYGNYKRLLSTFEHNFSEKQDFDKLIKTVFDNKKALSRIVETLQSRLQNDYIGDLSQMLFNFDNSYDQVFEDFERLIV